MASLGSAIVVGVGPERGLGATLAQCFAKKGLHVFIAGRSQDKLQHISQLIQNAGGCATPVVTDVTLEQDVKWQMHGLYFLSPMMESQNNIMAAAIFLLAGFYQFSPLKNTFLQNCRSPMGFLLTEWRDGSKGALQMGLKHGSMCLGCCWAQMMIMFAVGVMNLLGVVLITLLVLIEKTVPMYSQSFSRVVGFLLVGWGVWLLTMG